MRGDNTVRGGTVEKDPRDEGSGKDENPLKLQSEGGGLGGAQ